MDDIILTRNSPAFIKSITSMLYNVFALEQLGDLDYFLGLEVKKQSNGNLLLTQSNYIRDLLLKTGTQDAKQLATPMVSSSKLSKYGSPRFGDPSLYRSVVGAVKYATIAHPELSYSLNKVCQFMAAPLETHWLAVKRILRYLQ